MIIQVRCKHYRRVWVRLGCVARLGRHGTAFCRQTLKTEPVSWQPVCAICGRHRTRPYCACVCTVPCMWQPVSLSCAVDCALGTNNQALLEGRDMILGSSSFKQARFRCVVVQLRFYLNVTRSRGFMVYNTFYTRQEMGTGRLSLWLKVVCKYALCYCIPCVSTLALKL